MSAIKKISKKKLVLLLLILTMALSGTAYAAYKIEKFNGVKENVTSISNVLKTVKDLTTQLTETTSSLWTEKNNHNKDVNDANQQIRLANDYADSVSGALKSTTKDTETATKAILEASSAVNYDPSSQK
ncbi:hypothetical protein [Limosilactobacillus fermentum]|uniref:hypothetical protein n=1 Tax=Limosilactobacillus fermentum TaxID=1613 RepID=UPI00128BAC73|nr:hypothetical protein [Limosilactobacillus fermentum]MPW03903.1 hypothetical protein [Limosilactobacillus fermentum]